MLAFREEQMDVNLSWLGADRHHSTSVLSPGFG